MKKYLPLLIVAILVLVAGGVYFFSKANANDQEPDLVETPPTISKVNSLAIAKRPYVELIPHSNLSRCNGVDMNITNFKNGEKLVEYELEYTTEKMIQGVFGRRELTGEEQKHQPLEFGTCSRGTCRCDDDITGGSLKLSFTGKEDYVLKGDFSVQNVGDKDDVITSRDARFKMDFSSSLADSADVLVTSTFGFPAEVSQKVILGPYGIFVEGSPSFKKPAPSVIQSHEASNAQILFWNGESWEVLESTVEEGSLKFDLPSLGVVILTEK